MHGRERSARRSLRRRVPQRQDSLQARPFRSLRYTADMIQCLRKADCVNKEYPVVLLSTYGLSISRRRGRLYRASDLVTRPRCSGARLMCQQDIRRKRIEPASLGEDLPTWKTRASWTPSNDSRSRGENNDDRRGTGAGNPMSWVRDYAHERPERGTENRHRLLCYVPSSSMQY